jgi:DNA-binding CsgD family transcriptional regulator/tetratricopeptide (TPR) repeat protein
MPITSPRTCPILVDREADLAALDALLVEANAARGRLVLVAGEAGAGKSRLAREVADRAAAAGFRILGGACSERDHDFPFAPFVDALHQYRVEAPVEIAPRGGSEREILADLLSQMRNGVELSAGHGPPPDQIKRRLFETIGTSFARLAARQPLLVVLEDLHWADPTSLELLELLPRRIAASRVLILATARSDEPAPDWQRTLTSLHRARAVVELTLAPLGEAGVGRMMRSLMRAPPSPAFVSMIHTRTDGNPFFVEELLASVPAHGDWWFGEAAIPTTVQETVLQRVSDFDSVARDVVEVAAVIGHRVNFDLLLAACELSQTELLRVLRLLIDRQILIAEDAPGLGSFAFRHALTRDALLGQLLLPQRRARHRVVAAALQRTTTGNARSRAGDDARDLGYHFHAAGIWPEALTYALRAGEAAERLHATVEALSHHRRALDAAVALDDPRAADLHRRCGLALDRLGAFDEAEGHFAAALAQAQELGLVDVELTTLYDLSGLHASRNYPAARRWAERALALARASDDPHQEGRALNRLGNVLTNLLQFSEGRTLHEDALSIFEREGDQWGSADSLDLMGMARYLAGEVPEARQALGRAATLFGELGDRVRVASALTTRGLYLAVLDGPCATNAPPADFAADAAEGLRLCQDIAWRSGEAYALAALACADLGAGQYGEAHRHASQALAIAEEIEHPQWTVIALLTLGLLDVELCQYRAAQERFQHARDLAQAAGAVQWVERLESWIAYCRVRSGEIDIPLLADRRLDAPTTRLASIGQRRASAAMVHRALALNKPEAALVRVDHLLGGAAGPRPAGVILLRADVLAALGRTAEADAGYRDARRTAEAVGPRSVLWRGAAARADLWRERDPELTTIETETARAEIARLAETLTNEAQRRAFMAAPEVQPWLAPSGRRRTASTATPGGLTARERDVAIAVARGASNKEIAHSLGIAEKTVEMHVSSCLGKLAFTSRAQLAAWVVAEGLGKL